MESPLMIALSRADVLQRQMDIVANNIANVNTRGYKAERVLFELAEKKPIPSQPLDFVIDRSTYRDLTPGSIEQTGNALDVALNGNGWLSVRLPDGSTGYTRNGSMTLNPDGTIVDQLGNIVQGEGGTDLSITADSGEITIGIDGTINTERAVIGKLEVVSFDNPQKLIPYGDGYFKAEGAAPLPNDGSTRVIQGTIEGSNVVAVREMTEMMDVARSYQSVQKIIENEHDRIRNAISKIARSV